MDHTFSKAIFEQIRTHVSRCLSIDDPMQPIEAVLNTLDIGDLGETFFDVAWDFSYFTVEMDQSQSLGSMPTFTGSIDAAWATTSKEYVEKDMARNRDDHSQCQEKSMKSGETGYYHLNNFGAEARPARIKVQGSKRQTVQVAQQLAWMMALFPNEKKKDSEEKH